MARQQLRTTTAHLAIPAANAGLQVCIARTVGGGGCLVSLCMAVMHCNQGDHCEACLVVNSESELTTQTCPWQLATVPEHGFGTVKCAGSNHHHNSIISANASNVNSSMLDLVVVTVSLLGLPSSGTKLPSTALPSFDCLVSRLSQQG